MAITRPTVSFLAIITFLLPTIFRISAFAIPTAARSLRRTTMAFFFRSSSKMTTTSSAAAAATTCLAATTNPLLADWSPQPFHLPPFSQIETDHFPSALEEGRKQHLADLQAIVDNTEEPTFDSVLAPYDRAGNLLDKVAGVFYNLCSSQNTDELKKVQTEQSPLSSRHRSATYTLPGLFDKIQTVYEKRHDSNLTEEQIRLTERVYMDFTRAGAKFDLETQKEYAEIQAELASLTTQFTQNVMKDEELYELVLHQDDLAGCPDSLVEAAKQAAVDRNKSDDEYVITLSRSLVEPFLTFADRRDLRKEAWEAWTKRGELSPDRDNVSIAEKILKLRQKVAKLHGYQTFAEFQTADRMAKTPENVMELLENVWDRAKESANREREALEDYVRTIGEELEGGVEAWDWRYYAEKVRIAKYDFDESLLKPYLSLDSMTDALFSVSGNLFGLQYKERPDIVTYHPDVKVYEVRETLEDGSDKLRAVFLHDNYARPFKSSGAWMSEFRSQTKNLADGTDGMEAVPVVINNNNFAKGKNTLLSFDDAETLFHEAGHGHHGMLSDASYGRLAGTNVLADFVELPSQLLEHWFRDPKVLKQYAKHVESGESVPDELLDKLMAARSFNEGFATVEFTICALLDMALHQVDDYTDFDLLDFEKKELERLGMPKGIVMRHRPAHFGHLFSGGFYAAGYYVYLWAEVLDADAFAAFKESGDIFDKDVAANARKYIYSSGNTKAPDELFRQFRGRDPDINFMLEKKGLLEKVP